jgi:NAD(P)-dependent dehydrogenase (short-subunit alcohol dehydrogenase family)
MGRVEGKVAIVTGGASGIGSATARLLAKEGASVVVSDLDERAAGRIAAEIVSDGGRAISQLVDIGHEETVAAMVGRTVETYGTVGVLFNNAADTSSETMLHDRPVHLIETEWWDRAFRIDLRGTMLCCKYVLPHMIKAGAGSIISTSSNQALVGDLSLREGGCDPAHAQCGDAIR